MSTAARTPRAVVGAVLLAGALAYVAAGLARRSGTSPGADPWLAAALLVGGAWLLGGALVAAQQQRVSAAALRRHPELPLLLDAADVRGESLGTPAWESPATRAAWHSSLRRAWWPFAVAVAVLVAVLLPVRSFHDSDTALGASGVRADGTVVASGWAYEGRGGRAVADVTYVFNAHPYSARVASPDPAAVPRGTRLGLRVDPDHPEHVRAEDVAGTTSALEWWTTLGSLAVGALLAVGVVTVLHLLARRRQLTTHPWVTGTLDAHGPTGTVTTSGTTTVVGAPRRRLPTSEVLVLPAPGRRLLVALPHGTHTELLLPRTVAQGRRWLDATQQPAHGPRHATPRGRAAATL